MFLQRLDQTKQQNGSTISFNFMQSITITISELKTTIREAVKVELENFRLNLGIKKDEDLVPRKKAARLLDIDLSTLRRWTNDDLLKDVKIRGRVYYRKSENPGKFD